MIKKIISALKLIKGRRWGVFFDRLPLYKKLASITNLIPHPNNYRYILIGGHGVGMVSMKYYLNKLKAKPCEILSYEIVRPFVFYRKFDGLLFDKEPLNSDMYRIMKRCNKKVPLYQLVRCPIETIKSNVNANILHAISNIKTQKDADKIVFDVINNLSHLMFYFKSTRNLVSHISQEVNYITMQDINDKNMYNTLQKFASKFNYDINTLNINGGGYESVIKGKLFPRFFPEFFTIGNNKFVISTESRLNGESRKEIDMNTNTSKVLKSIKNKFNIIKNNLRVDGYEEYPLLIASLGRINNEVKENIMS